MSDNNVLEMPGAMTGIYAKGKEPWSSWLLVYKCTQCDKFVSEKPKAETLALLDLQYLDNPDDEPTLGTLLQIALSGSEATSCAHECDKRAVGVANLTGAIREGSNILVVGK